MSRTNGGPIETEDGQIKIRAKGTDPNLKTKEDFIRLYNSLPVYKTNTRFFKNFSQQIGEWKEQDITITGNFNSSRSPRPFK